MPPEHPNSARKKELEEKLVDYLREMAAAGTLPTAGGRICRSKVVLAIGGAENWASQNGFARKTFAEWDAKVGARDSAATNVEVPGHRERGSDLLRAKVQRLERINLQLREENAELRRRLASVDWVDDIESSSQGRLPW